MLSSQFFGEFLLIVLQCVCACACACLGACMCECLCTCKYVCENNGACVHICNEQPRRGRIRIILCSFSSFLFNIQQSLGGTVQDNYQSLNKNDQTLQ